MVYQHGSPFYDEDELECRKMHRKVYKSFPISRVYQHIFQPVRQATGCLGLHRRNIIRFMIWMQKDGMHWG